MSFIAWPSWCSLEAQWGAEREPRNPKRTEADHQGGLCLAGSPFSRVLIIAPFLPSMRNCTIVLAFAQADRTCNASPNAKEKALSLTLSEISQGDGAFSCRRLA